MRIDFLAILLLGCLSTWAGSLAAGEVKGLKESTIGVAPYRALFVNAGVDGELPQVLVYGPSGRCLGTLDHGAQGRLAEAIDALLRSPKPGCLPFLSSEFGGTGPRPETAPGRITVQLLVFSGDFCTACADMEGEFRALAGADATREWRLTRVSLEAGFNAPKDGVGRDCAHCPKQRTSD